MCDHHEQVTRRRRASGKEDGDCGEKDFPRGSGGVTTLVRGRGGPDLVSILNFLSTTKPTSAAPPPEQLKRPFQHS